MSKPWNVHPEVDEEVLRAAAWYLGQREGLEEEFLEDVDATRASLESAPSISTLDITVPKRLGARRRHLGRFPFAVIFVERRDEYLIVAVARLTREPGYWLHRLDD